MTDFTPSHLQRDNAELIAACAVPLVERLARIPRDAILRWTDEDELQASHSVPIGLLAHEAASRLESLSPQPPAETGEPTKWSEFERLVSDAELPEWLMKQARDGGAIDGIVRLKSEEAARIASRLEALSRKGRGE